MEQQIAAADAHLAGGDGPWDALAGLIRACVSFRAGVFSSVAGTIPVTAEMSVTARHAHELLERLVVRAHQTGSLRQDVSGVDIYQLIELFSPRRPDDEGAYQRLLAIALDGLRTPGRESSGLTETTPLPGSPPTWESYARRWLGRSAGDRELPS